MIVHQGKKLLNLKWELQKFQSIDSRKLEGKVILLTDLSPQ